MNASEERQLEAEADAFEADAQADRISRDRLGRLRWVVVSMEDDRREVAAFCSRGLATAWMDAVGHLRIRLVERL